MSNIVQMAPPTSGNRFRRSFRRWTRPKKKPGKKPAKKTAKKTTTVSSPSLGKSDSKYVQSQIDPFDENVDGVKIPDANSMPSNTLKAEDYFSPPLSAGESCRGWAINSTLYNLLVNPGAGSAGTTWSWAGAYGNGSFSSKLVQYRNENSSGRPVAQGVRLTCGLAPTTLTGFVHVALYVTSVYNQSTWDLPTSIAEMANLPGYKRMPLSRLTSEGLVIVNKPLDSTSQRYIDADAQTTQISATQMEFHIPNQWATIMVAVDGAPLGSTPLAFEIVTHYESIPRPTSVISATPAAAYSPAALGAASGVNARAPPVYADSERGVRRAEGVQAARRGMDKVLGRAGNLARAARYAAAGQKAGAVAGPLGRLVGGAGGFVAGLRAPKPAGITTNYNIGSAFNKGPSHMVY